jgi:hypothetical protein
MERRRQSLTRRKLVPIRPWALGLLLACTASVVQATPEAPPSTSPSADARQFARWVIQSGDNAGMPFVLVDKPNAEVLAFNGAGQLQGSAPALLGMARGDRLLAPNEATMAEMRPQERITPAGRFVSRLARDSDGKELLVLDYQAAISLHPVIKGTPAERRAERLRSATRQDNRISYGCINVPPDFYSTIVSPAFAHTKGIVYVLPETVSAASLFGMDNTQRLATSPKNEARLAPGSGSGDRAAISRGTASAP